jgi:O-antigen/teichoic acid export membrane protein
VFAAASAAVNIALTLALTPLFGMWGVVGATVATIVGTSVVALVVFHRTHRVPAADSVRAIGTPVLLSLAAALPIVLWLAVEGTPDAGRVSGAIGSIAFVAVFLAIYWPAASRMGILPDKLALRPLLRRARAVEPV